MRTYNTSEGILEVVDFNIEPVDNEPDKYVFTITEGEHAGVQFMLDSMKISDTDESLLEYDLSASDGVDVDKIKPIVDNIILVILYEQIERAKELQHGTITLTEVDSERDPDA